MRPARLLLVAIAITGLGPGQGKAEEPAAAEVSGSRPRMTMLEKSDADPLADVEKAVRRQAARKPGRRRGGAAAMAVPAAPLAREVGAVARDKAMNRGLDFLVAAQRPDGGWNQQGDAGGSSDVANTSIAGLSLLRVPTDNADTVRNRQAVQRAADFVVRQVGASRLPDTWQPAVVDRTVNNDLGSGSDAALATLFLAAVAADRGADGAGQRDAVGRLLQYFDKLLTEQPQAFQGRAQGLSRAVLAHAAVVAGRAGVPVPERLLDRLTEDCPAARDLYGRAARIGCLHAAALEAGGLPPAEAATLADAIVRPVLADYHGRWPYGAGGEVFLSLMFLGAMLTDSGGSNAVDWSRGVDALLVQAQNGDGSWTGSSCINSRAFCTSSALLVMGTAPGDGRVAAR